MKIYPDQALSQLRLADVLQWVAERASGLPAQEYIRQMIPTSSLRAIEQQLIQVDFLCQGILFDTHLTLASYLWPDEINRCLTIEDYVLNVEDIHQLIIVLENLKSWHTYLTKVAEADWRRPSPFEEVVMPHELYHSLIRVIDDRGQVRSDASPELQHIDRQIDKKRGEISHLFNRIAKEYRTQGLLSEFQESFKNGRRVLALPVENKRKIPGVIHGDSDSGRTVYIEPQEVTLLNNAIYQLELDRQKEIYRLLKDLCTSIRLHDDSIPHIAELICVVDIANAIAQTAIQQAWAIPQVDPQGTFHLKAAFHPILKHHLERHGRSIVENDIVLYNQNRILILSGPNAGGKSIMLQTVALTQIMFQCGLPIPASVDSKMRVYETIALDFGDNQSLDDDLSTYSAHLYAMKSMLSLANDQALLLIDEFGTGTDPKVGGALAESILHSFVKSGASAVITTHYSNIKAYANKTRGVVNGSMSFDMDKLMPTYNIQIGKPGSSFAFEIAQRVGLPDDIIRSARKTAGNQVYEMEKLLSQLNYEKQLIEEKLIDIRRKENELQYLQSTYTSLKKELDIQRKKYKAERKEELAKLKAKNIQYLEDSLSQIKLENQSIEQVEDILRAEKNSQMQAVQSAQQLDQEAQQLSGEWLDEKDLTVGDYVRIRDTQTTGQVLSIDKKKVRLSSGAMIVDTAISKLQKINPPIQQKSSRSIQYEKKDKTVPSRIDIRGMTFKEAEQLLLHYIDDALIQQMNMLEVVHGRGNGVLKKLVQRVVNSYAQPISISHPDEEAGGDAVSYLRFG